MSDFKTEDVIYALCDYLGITPVLTGNGVEMRSRKKSMPKCARTGMIANDYCTKKSCRSCRFHAGQIGVDTYCRNEYVNRCFRHPVSPYVPSVKEFNFSCSFYEFNLDFDERFGGR